MSKGAIFSFASDTTTRIDAEAGVILGVAVITEGPALGHFDWSADEPLPLYADADTLKGVMACASEYEGGLKVKFNHGSGVGDIVGRLNNFRIDGKVLRADFHALSTAPHRAYLFEIAATIPDSFGLSVSFSGNPARGTDRAFARCTEIYSADFVDEPAANPNGLFHRGDRLPAAVAPTQPKSNLKMEDEKKEDPIAAMSATIAALSERLAAFEAKFADESGDEEKLEDGEKKDEAMSALAEKAALAALKTYTAQFGAPPAKVSHEAKREDKTQVTFESIVAAKAIELKSKAKAIAWAVQNHPAEHKAMLARAATGETINL
jgi:hypothetical protein